MSELKLHLSLFQGKTIHTLTVDGRPAWIARQVGGVLGYAGDGKRLVGKITLEWGDDFVLGKDYALLTGPELVAVKAEVDAVSPQAKGLLVLFESGLHMALVKSQMPLGRALRRFLVDEVLPHLVRSGAYQPQSAPEADPVTLDTATLREARLAARVDLDDHKFRSAELRRTADVLRLTRRIDGDLWVKCTIAACEIALGHALPGLHAAVDQWTDPAALAARLDVPVAKVMGAAGVLRLLDHKPGLSRPVPTRDEGGRWTVTFAFSTAAAAQIEGWLAETSDDARRPAAQAA